jgi:hypothetical protein
MPNLLLTSLVGSFGRIHPSFSAKVCAMIALLNWWYLVVLFDEQSNQDTNRGGGNEKNSRKYFRKYTITEGKSQ